MAYEILGSDDIHTETAGVDLRALQYRAVRVNGSGVTVLPTLGGDITGVNQDKPNIGEAHGVAHSGVTKWQSGAAIAYDAEVTTDANGKCITAATGHAGLGRALIASAGDGVIIPVRLRSKPAVI